jgi:transposase InsO family protein
VSAADACNGCIGRKASVVDIFSHHRPILEADLSLNAPKVVAALERAAKPHGYLQVIPVDNGSEFQSKALDAWAYEHRVNSTSSTSSVLVSQWTIASSSSFNARL